MKLMENKIKDEKDQISKIRERIKFVKENKKYFNMRELFDLSKTLNDLEHDHTEKLCSFLKEKYLKQEEQQENV